MEDEEDPLVGDLLTEPLSLQEEGEEEEGEVENDIVFQKLSDRIIMFHDKNICIM